jgi:CheY-like chemotaxis protein
LEHVASGSPHVLVFDDDVSTRQLFREALEEEGYRVTLASSTNLEPLGVTILALDLIVLDLRVRHEAEGVTFLERLKDHPITRPVPMLVCSADHRLLERLHDQLAAWDCGVLRKPFGLEEFLSAIRACLGRALWPGCSEEQTSSRRRPAPRERRRPPWPQSWA